MPKNNAHDDSHGAPQKDRPNAAAQSSQGILGGFHLCIPTLPLHTLCAPTYPCPYPYPYLPHQFPSPPLDAPALSAGLPQGQL